MNPPEVCGDFHRHTLLMCTRPLAHEDEHSCKCDIPAGTTFPDGADVDTPFGSTFLFWPQQAKASA